MEIKDNFIEPLLERTEEFSKTSFELLKLKFTAKTADIGSILISRFLSLIILSFFALTINIAVALWLGDLLGKNYYGFLVVASFYGVIAIVLFFIHPFIKDRVNNSIIKQMLS
jgi:hypothetical protein